MNKYEIVYGDSVSGNTQIRVNDTYITIESLFTDVTDIVHGKECCRLKNQFTDVIANDGNVWQYSINYIIRHKTNKNMYRVWFGNTNFIDVTEDHSLITFKNNKFVEIKPTDNHLSVVWESCSMPQITPTNYDTEVYEFLGFFLGDGSVIYKNNKSHYGWLACGFDYDEIEQKLLIPLKSQGMIKSYWKKKKGDVCFNGKILYIIDEHIKTKNGKQFPQFILKDTIFHQRAFMRGFFSADGTVIVRENRPIIRLTSITTEHIINAQRCLLNCDVASNWFTEATENSYKGKYSGSYSKHLVVKNAKSFHFVGFILDRKQHKLGKYIPKKNDICLARPTKIELIETPEYVYDIEVADIHRFFGNHILLHNTDSVAVANVNSIEDGKRLESVVNGVLLDWAHEHNIKDDLAPTVKFEKYFKSLFFKKRSGSDEAAKKKYVGWLRWKDGKEKDELSYTGIEIKRSDTAPYTKEVMEEFFKLVLIEDNTTDAVQLVKNSIEDIKQQRVDLHKIAVPKGVKSLEGTGAYQKGCKIGTELFNIKYTGDKKPKLVYCISPYPQVCIDDEITTEEVLSKVTVDWAKMADVVIAQKFRSLVESVGVSWDTINGQQKLF
jgi:DNA polymerase I